MNFNILSSKVTSNFFHLCILSLLLNSIVSECKEKAGNKSRVKPYALSSVYLSELAKTEQILHDHVKDYIKILKIRIELAYTYVGDFKERKFQTNKEVAENPLSAYKMIRRLAKPLNSLLKDIQEDPEAKFLKKIDLYERNKAQIPDQFDHEEALEALIHMQYFYDLKPFDLIKGTIKNKPHNHRLRLTPVESQEITEFSVDKKYFYLAMEWLQAQKISTKSLYSLDLSYFGFRSIQELTNNLTDMHDAEFETNLEKGNPYMYTAKLGQNPTRLPETLKEKLSKESKNSTAKIMGIGAGSFTYNYLALCNGQELMSEHEKSKLYCWLDTKRNPYFTISPLKMEYLHKDPLLLQIHDIVNDKWIEDIKNASYSSLSRAPKPLTSADTVRSAIYAWLDDSDIPNVPISRLHELLFNLNSIGYNASEHLQVASYALGGLVSLHVDYLGGITNEEDKGTPEPVDEVAIKGDRVSSFLIYLNDVEMGGFTAFPKLKTFVRPVKGSALFWYTSLRNGLVDPKTLHGACPILYGHKWIATKWVHQNQNFLKRPCALDHKL